MGGWSVVIACFHQRHAQQIRKKFPTFGLSNPGQDFEHLLEIIPLEEIAAAVIRDEILTGIRACSFLRLRSSSCHRLRILF